jgi:hypothetical protein
LSLVTSAATRKTFVNAPATEKQPPRWLNRTVLGIGLASLLSDWSHEIATTVLPAFLATMQNEEWTPKSMAGWGEGKI